MKERNFGSKRGVKDTIQARVDAIKVRIKHAKDKLMLGECPTTGQVMDVPYGYYDEKHRCPGCTAGHCFRVSPSRESLANEVKIEDIAKKTKGITGTNIY